MLGMITTEHSAEEGLENPERFAALRLRNLRARSFDQNRLFLGQNARHANRRDSATRHQKRASWFWITAPNSTFCANSSNAVWKSWFCRAARPKKKFWRSTRRHHARQRPRRPAFVCEAEIEVIQRIDERKPRTPDVRHLSGPSTAGASVRRRNL